MTDRPNPGLGYKVREFLGGGNWKSAYRATSPYSLADVALLFFHDDDKPDIVVKDVTSLLRTISQHRYADYLAKFFGFQRGEDGRFFIIEELLDRPLEGLAPLNDLVQFVRISRDLSRGLLCLHESKLVHRDLKLDNCGLDHQQRAKIFDLGSVTSDGGDVRGTVFTRAPELFVKSSVQCDFVSDVWALGATLYALRTGDYPFVFRSEIRERKLINDEVREGKISEKEGRCRKEKLNSVVAERISGRDAEKSLRHQVHSSLRGRAEEILTSMLEFDRDKRLSIQSAERAWSAYAEELSNAASRGRPRDKWEKIKAHVKLAERKELVLTKRQIDRIISEYDTDSPADKDNELKNALRHLKESV